MLVVARGDSVLNKFEQDSLLRAINLKDFLEQTGQYSDVSIYQLRPTDGGRTEWAKLDELEA